MNYMIHIHFIFVTYTAKICFMPFMNIEQRGSSAVVCVLSACSLNCLILNSIVSLHILNNCNVMCCF